MDDKLCETQRSAVAKDIDVLNVPMFFGIFDDIVSELKRVQASRSATGREDAAPMPTTRGGASTEVTLVERLVGMVRRSGLPASRS